MSINLRPYQEAMVASIRSSIGMQLSQRHSSGSGQYDKLYFICHRQELLDQTSMTFAEAGVPHSFVAAGYLYDDRAPVQICSIDTLKNRLARLPKPKLVIWDECHHVAAAGWERVFNAWGGDVASLLQAPTGAGKTAIATHIAERSIALGRGSNVTSHIGLTATPVRLDGRGLGRYFNDLVLGPPVAELIEAGWLSEYIYYGLGDRSTLSGVGSVGGDYNKRQLAELYDGPALVGDFVDHYQEKAAGLKAMGFAVNVKLSQQYAEEFERRGIWSAHLDGRTPKARRREVLAEFAAQDGGVLWNVGLFGEGFDLAANSGVKNLTVDCLIDAQPTKSLGRQLQKLGRVLRPKPHPAVILDHAGNIVDHGLPDDERHWSLTEDIIKDAEPPTRQCPVCSRVFRPAPVCPQCGYVFLVAERRQVTHIREASLVQIDEARRRMDERTARREEQARCETLEDFERLGRKRGYRPGWALHAYYGRLKKGRR